MTPLAVFTTVGSLEEARRLAAAAVERRVAACVQICTIESFYRWQGAVQNEPEFRLLFKTTVERYEALEHTIRELHSYEVPAIWSCSLERMFAPYADWVAENTAAP